MKIINDQYFTAILAKKLSQESGISESVILGLAKQAVEGSIELSNNVCELYNNLKIRVVHFCYRKANESLREAWGTLDPVMLANFEEAQSKNSSCKPARYQIHGCITYFDAEQKNWRSFKVKNFLYMY